MSFFTRTMSFRTSSGMLLTCCCVATFSDVFTYGVLPPILPFVLVERAHVSEKDVSFYVAALPAVLAGATVISAPLAGWLSDRSHYRRPLFLFASLLQMIGIILFLVGTSIALWICGAAICGIASAIVWPTSMALMLDGIPLEQSAQFLGYTSLSLCVGMFLGPVLGGLIYAYHGHNAVWALVLGVAAFDLVLRLLLVEPRASQKGKILSEQPLPPGEKTTGSIPLAFGLLLRSKRVLSALWAAFVQATVLTSFDGALVIHVTSVFGWDAGRASLLWIAIVLPSLATPLVGMMVDRFGGKYFGTVGFLVSAVCLVALRFVDSDSLGQKVLLCAMLALIGASLGTIIPVFSAEVNVVANELAKGSGGFGDRGIFAQAGAVWWATYTMGLAIGPLWGGLVRESAGWATMGWSLAILCAVTAVPVFRYTS